MSPLNPTELVYLYRHLRRIHPTERELRLLLASMLHNIETGHRKESPGAYWLGKSSPPDFLRWFIQIERWAAKERSSLRPFHEWVKTFPLRGLESHFAALAGDPIPPIRAICAEWIGRTRREEDLPLLRELAKDENSDVRTAAVEVLASFSRSEDLPLLRELAKDQDSRVRTTAVEALASFSRPEDLPLLRELAKDQKSRVRTAAMNALASYAQAEDMPLLRERAGDSDSAVRAAVVEALAKFSRAEALPLLRKLALALDDNVATEAICGLASRCSHEELEVFLNGHEQELCASALAALDELLYMPEWLKAKGTASAVSPQSLG